MPVEVAKLVDDFNKLWPRGTDPVSKADDHIRMIKEVLQLEFELLYNKTRVFSFEAGAVVNPDCILYYEAEKAFYQWNGAYDVNNEYVVYAGSTPETAGGIGGNAWTRSTGSGFVSTVLVSDTEPTAPFQNMLWWDTNSGTFFIYYNDGTSTQWVDLFGIADQASFNTLLFRPIFARLAAESGYTLVDGSFQEGAVSSGSSDVVLDWNTAKFYQWHLNENKEVPAGSTPETTGGIGAGAWVDRTDITLRQELVGDGSGFIAEKIEKTVTGTNAVDLVSGSMADDDKFRIRIGGTANDAGWSEIATADNGTEPIYVRQYNGDFVSVARTLTLLDGSGNTVIPGRVWCIPNNAFLNTVTVITGTVYHGNWLPIPDGYSEGQCRFFISMENTNPHDNSWDLREGLSTQHYSEYCRLINNRQVEAVTRVYNDINDSFQYHNGYVNYIVIGVK